MYCAYFHFAWVLSCNLVRKGQGVEGFIMANPKDDPDCDIPICYRSQCMGWRKSVSAAVNRPEFISQLKLIPHGTQAISFIKVCGDHGMQFLQMSDQIFHAALIRVP